MSHFPLEVAYHCQNCNQVGDKSRACACCGSQSLLNLSSILNRDPLREELRAIVEEFKGVLAEVVG